jgi:hypothetical protein
MLQLKLLFDISHLPHESYLVNQICNYLNFGSAAACQEF